MPKSIIIIGGGIAGLSAGCYCRMNGFNTTILEMHSIAGGLCTAWKKKRYTFDGCIHWLTGSKPGTGFYSLWEEVGAVQGKRFHSYEYFTQAADGAGNRLVVYTDPDRFRDAMLSLSPEDARSIRKITGDIKRLSRRDMPLEFSFANLFRMIPFILMIFKYRKPVSDLARRFRSPILRNLFAQALAWRDMSAAFALWTLSIMAAGDGMYPIGGSLGFARSMLERYRALGGSIRFNSRVKKILVENGRATGVRLVNGTEIRADIVVSAADGHATIFDMLDGKFIDKKIRGNYERLDPFPPLVYLSFGLAGDYSKEPHSISFPATKPFKIGPDEITKIGVRFYSFDPTMAPKGKTVMIVMIETSWEHWEEMDRNSARYRAEKERIRKAVMDNIAARYPAIRRQVEVADVATPLTFFRYTGNWRGSYEGWVLNRKALGVQLPQVLPGLLNFYMAGHWLSPGGGLPAAILTARNAVKMICRNEKRSFRATRS